MRRAGQLLSLLAACAAAGALAATVLADNPPPTTSTSTDTTPTTTTPTTTTTTTTTTEPTIATGVTIGGIPVGGMTQADALTALTDAFAQPIVLHFAGVTISIAPDLLGATAAIDRSLARAATAAPGSAVGLAVTVDRPVVSTFVDRLAKRFDRKPSDSRLLLRNFKPYITPAKAGRTILRGDAVRRIVADLTQNKRTTIELRAKILKPAVTAKTVGPVIVIRRDSNLLSLYNGMRPVRQFAVATGQRIYPTPLGRFQIVVMWKNPWWYPPASPWAKGEKPVPPGPGNPLGTRWMGLSAPGVGIHGTPQDGSIGYSLSHGCIRMHIPEAEWLFNHVTVGTPVFIVSA